MKEHSMYLRTGCLLPDGLNIKGQPFGNEWQTVDELAEGLDVKIRERGWHFVWLSGTHSRVAFGLTRLSAIDRATKLVLKRISYQFNAAQFETLRLWSWPGFCTARVTLRARQIQPNASLLGLIDRMIARNAPA
jgi:hypothetical protein